MKKIEGNEPQTKRHVLNLKALSQEKIFLKIKKCLFDIFVF